MPKIRNLLTIFLVLGVIYAEFLPTLQPATSLTAYSQTDFAPNQSELLLEFFDDAKLDGLSVANTSITIDLNQVSNNLTDLFGDISEDINISIYTQPTSFWDDKKEEQNNDQSSTIVSNPIPAFGIPAQDQHFTRNIIPKVGTPLFEAYSQGGTAWYQEEDKVIVSSPEQTTFRSFQISTGEETSWLQDRLNYDPIDSPNALANYLANYHGEVVAETPTWAFVKFPSGGFIKISKQSTIPLSSGPFLTQQ